MSQLIANRYESFENLGEGPLFSYTKVRDQQTEKPLMLLRIVPALQAEAPFLEGLRSGSTAAEALQHPRIAASEGFSREDGGFLLFEFCSGIHLKERIRRISPFTLAVAVDIALSTAEGLVYAHSMGQVHGSLRSQNIIISSEGEVKITEFGIHRGICRSAVAQEAIATEIVPYFAPELRLDSRGTASGDI